VTRDAEEKGEAQEAQEMDNLLENNSIYPAINVPGRDSPIGSESK